MLRGRKCRFQSSIFVRMNRSIWILVLMVITLLVITGFQAWWLNDLYDREKAALTTKMGVVFHETVRELKTFNLKFRFPVAGDGSWPRIGWKTNEVVASYPTRINVLP